MRHLGMMLERQIFPPAGTFELAADGACVGAGAVGWADPVIVCDHRHAIAVRVTRMVPPVTACSGPMRGARSGTAAAKGSSRACGQDSAPCGAQGGMLLCQVLPLAGDAAVAEHCL